MSIFPKPCAYFCVCPQMARLGFLFFTTNFPPDTATGIRTHGRVAPSFKDSLQAELHGPLIKNANKYYCLVRITA